MQSKTFLTLLCAVLFSAALSAQQLLEPSFNYSRKKTAEFTKVDGSTVKGTIKAITVTRGLIKAISIKDEKGKTIKLKPEDVKFMYLPPSALDKMNKAMEVAYDAQKWDNKTIDDKLIKEGYIYFEQTKVTVKKTTSTLLMQLLNPHFSDKIRIYHNPYATESASIGIGGITVAGGEDRSYYVKKTGDDNVAFKVFKGDYSDHFKTLWSDCEAVMKKYEKKIRWADFSEHAFEYNECKK